MKVGYNLYGMSSSPDYSDPGGKGPPDTDMYFNRSTRLINIIGFSIATAVSALLIYLVVAILGLYTLSFGISSILGVFAGGFISGVIIAFVYNLFVLSDVSSPGTSTI